ncbi:unnamed protein product [Penicillium pancosmium]
MATINGDACDHVDHGGDDHLRNANVCYRADRDADRDVFDGRHSGGGERVLNGFQSDGHARYGDYRDDGQCDDDHRFFWLFPLLSEAYSGLNSTLVDNRSALFCSGWALEMCFSKGNKLNN